MIFRLWEMRSFSVSLALNELAYATLTEVPTERPMELMLDETFAPSYHVGLPNFRGSEIQHLTAPLAES